MLKPIHRKVSLVLIAIAVYYLYLSFQLPSFMNALIDASSMPKAVGFLLILLSVILFFTPDKETNEEKQKRQIPAADLLKLAGVFLMIVIYIFFLEKLGFIIVTTLFTFFSTMFLGYKKHLVNGIVAILFPFVLYVIFTVLLELSLPSGILPL
ncbi:tripartite tricarboxylate transporter TctB family protein [Alteribacillus sp. HJP-4]|uniref:tripartite tricarboxylate transporter TctB family protein n=1 Tax=Alteribacillus sp. HJP-4 TaxID=2775394 RepID=UPI0035CD326B